MSTVQIRKDLTKRYSSVVSIDMVGTAKLRVTVGDRKQANEIVACELFTLEYHVYLSSAQIEILEKVAEQYLACETIMPSITLLYFLSTYWIAGNCIRSPRSVRRRFTHHQMNFVKRYGHRLQPAAV